MPEMTVPIMTPMLALYLDLHRNPELSGQERRTAAVLAERLAEAGYAVTEGIGGHGVVGVLRNGDGPVVMVRAELDALPVIERTGLAYAAPAQCGAMHACGHDAHIACAVGAATLLARQAAEWRGTLVVLGQPAEEDLSGAAAMLADGLYERFGRPDVILAQHLAPLPAGLVAHADGLVTAASATLEVRLTGRGGHSGMPQLAINPISVAGGLIPDLERFAAGAGVVLSIGAIRAGNRANVIPEELSLSISLRAPTTSALDAAVAELSRITRSRCAAAQCPRPPEITRLSGSPAGVNDRSAAAIVHGAHARTFGLDRIVTVPPSGATEDFPLLAAPDGGEPIPSVYWILGATGHRQWAAAPGSSATEKLAALPVNHSARFAPDPVPTLRTGITAMAAAALAFLACQPSASALSDGAPAAAARPAS